METLWLCRGKQINDDAAVDGSSLRTGYTERGRSGKKRGRSGVDERGGGADVVP